MKTSRINPMIVAVIGIAACLIAVVALVFLLNKPTQDQITTQQARLDANAPGATREERDAGLKTARAAATKQLKDANVQVQQIQQQWAQKEAALMPPYDVSGDRFKALRQLTYELTHYLGPDLSRQMHAAGVISNVSFKLPPPPISPNDITNAPVVIPLSQITVKGDFRSILTHFYDWQYCNRLVLVDGLALHGNSPYMQGTYTATVYIFPQGDDKPAPPPVKGATGGAAGPGAPGARPPMGAMGMPMGPPH